MFAGFLERFRAISVLRHLNVSCLAVQDPIAPWYTGSDLCPGVADIKNVAEACFPWVKRDPHRPVERRLRGPVPFPLVAEQRVPCVGAAEFRRQRGQATIVALSAELSCVDDDKCGFESHRSAGRLLPERQAKRKPRLYRVCAFRARNPPTQWLWLDAMHWGRLVDHPDVTVFITPHLSHPVLLHNVETYAQLLRYMVQQPDWNASRLIPAFWTALYGA